MTTILLWLLGVYLVIGLLLGLYMRYLDNVGAGPSYWWAGWGAVLWFAVFWGQVFFRDPIKPRKGEWPDDPA